MVYIYIYIYQYIDFAKVFYVVYHEKLLFKLKAYGKW